MRDAAKQSVDACHALCTKELSLQLFFFRNVRVDDQNGFGMPGVVVHEFPPALHDDLFAILRNLTHLTDNCPFYFFRTRKRFLVQECIDVLAEGFRSKPTIQTFRTLIPKNNLFLEVTNNEGILCLIK